MKYLLLLLCLIISLPVYALQATINLPNSEVLDVNNIMVKEVTTVNPNKKYGSISPNITYGIGHKSEVSIGVPIKMKFDDSTFTIKGAIEAKKVFYIHDDTNRLTVGAGIFPYFNKSVCPDGFLYLHGTKKIKKTNTSFSIGGYASGDERLMDTGGLLMILDQKIYKDLNFVSEFTTGNGSRANYSAGLKYKFKGVSMTGAVIVPNHGNNIGFQLTLSKTLNFRRYEK